MFNGATNFYNLNNENFHDFLMEMYRKIDLLDKDTNYIRNHLIDELRKELRKIIANGELVVDIESVVDDFLSNGLEENKVVTDIKKKLEECSSQLAENTKIINNSYLDVCCNEYGVVLTPFNVDKSAENSKNWNIIKNKAKEHNKTIYFPSGEFYFEDTIIFDGITVKSYGAKLYSNSKLASQISQTSIIDGITLIKKIENQTGIKIGNESGNTGGGTGDESYVCGNSKLYNCNIWGFKDCVKFGNNAYLIRFRDCNISGTRGVVYDENLVNSGENIAFYGCSIGGGDISLDVSNYGMFYLFGCSLDYSKQFVKIKNQTIVNCIGCHFETFSSYPEDKIYLEGDGATFNATNCMFYMNDNKGINFDNFFVNKQLNYYGGVNISNSMLDFETKNGNLGIGKINITGDNGSVWGMKYSYTSNEMNLVSDNFSDIWQIAHKEDNIFNYTVEKDAGNSVLHITRNSGINKYSILQLVIPVESCKYVGYKLKLKKSTNDTFIMRTYFNNFKPIIREDSIFYNATGKKQYLNETWIGEGFSEYKVLKSELGFREKLIPPPNAKYFVIEIDLYGISNATDIYIKDLIVTQ